MPRTAKKYEDDLLERLRDREYAAEYLNGVLEDEGSDQQERFLLALRDVAKAYGMTSLAEDTELAREAMYRTLSKDGNPRLTTLFSLLDALELKLSVTTKRAS
jgi:probable addiction module antidote protein